MCPPTPLLPGRCALRAAILLVLAAFSGTVGNTPHAAAPAAGVGLDRLRSASLRGSGGRVAVGTALAQQAQNHRDEGDRLYELGQYCEAVEAYTAALRVDCSVSGAFGGRAAALLVKAQYGAAMHDALRAVDAATTSGGAGAGIEGLAEGQAPRAGSNRGEQMHAHLLAAKTLLAMGWGEEAGVHYEKAAQLADLGDAGANRRAALECRQGAREGIRHVRSYEALIRKAFANLHQTRDLFYVPIVGRWRSWRKPSASDGHDLPLGVPFSPSSARQWSLDGERGGAPYIGLAASRAVCCQRCVSWSADSERVWWGGQGPTTRTIFATAGCGHLWPRR